jgi:integrase
MNTDTADKPMPDDREKTKRTRRAEPITKRVAKNGAISYEFRVDMGDKPDGTRDRRRFTFRTLKEARSEYRRITTEVAAGTYNKPTAITVDQACDQWLAARRGIRRVTVYSYENDLKPVRRYLGGKELQKLTKTHVENLVRWMLTEARTSPRHYMPDSLAGRVAALVAGHPEGISAAELSAVFPGADVHSSLSALLATERVTRVRRGVYAPPAADSGQQTKPAGVSPQTVRSTLTTFSAVVQSFVNQGVLPRNIVPLVDRPKDDDPDAAAECTDDDGEDSPTTATTKSWTLTEVQAFRESVADHRLLACWLLSCYGLRRSEVLGLRWSAVDLDTGVLAVRRSRVAVGAGTVDGKAVGADTVEGAPKSKRSRRELPLPADVTEALRALRKRQRAEALALGVAWSDDRLVAVREDGEPLRPESYTDEFHKLRERVGLPRIRLHGLRNTSVTLMLEQGHPPHIVAAWHGHDPAVALRIYNDVKPDTLRAVGASLFG